MCACIYATYSVTIQRELAKWIYHHKMASSKGVYEARTVSLSEHMEHAGLIEVNQFNQVLHMIQRGWVSLLNIHFIHFQDIITAF